MARTKVVWQGIFELVKHRRFPEARELLKSGAAGKAHLADRLGLEGLMSVLSKNDGPFLPARLRALVRTRLSSVWSDPFDRAYFAVFRRYVQFLAQTGSADSEPSDEVGVVQNPAKEEQHDVAAQSGRG